MVNMVFFKTLLLLLVQLFVILASGFGHHKYPHSIHTDKAALLAFRRTTKHDPYSMLVNWDEAIDVCNFTGVICSRWHHRLEQINLQGAQIKAMLSPFIANLTGLHTINLSDNHLFGTIPSGFSSLRHLRHLLLDENDLKGSLSESFSFLANLTLVNVMNNYLTGTLPPSFFSNCTLLKNVDLSKNSLMDRIPELSVIENSG